MFATDGGRDVEVDALAERICAAPDVEGISVLGGEPFQQPGPLAALCQQVQAAGRSVMIYSGYRMEELQAQQDPAVAQLLAATDLLVDGRFEQALPESRRRWIGSTNQRVHFLTGRYRPDDARFAERNTVELRWENGTLTINGWPALADRVRR